VTWSREDQLVALMRLPWHVSVERAEDGYLVARVAEVPDAIGTGATEKELARDLWSSLVESLDARLEADAPLPLPQGTIEPWIEPERSNHPISVHTLRRGPAWDTSAATSALESSAASAVVSIAR
jgi:predicted RNase H-like HicB family nuclease